MAAPKGNNYNMKWKTPEKRQEAFEAACAHIAEGYTKECFPLADWDTVERYMRDFPEDFPSEKMDEAIRINQRRWETWGMGGVTGKIKHFNSGSWVFNMKNRFGWRDKKDVNLNNPDGRFAPVAALTDEEVEKELERRGLPPLPFDE